MVSRRGAAGVLSRRRSPAEHHNGCHGALNTILPTPPTTTHTHALPLLDGAGGVGQYKGRKEEEEGGVGQGDGVKGR